MYKDLDPTIVPELKLEQAVIAIRIGITNATGPIVLAATLYKMPPRRPTHVLFVTDLKHTAE